MTPLSLRFTWPLVMLLLCCSQHAFLQHKVWRQYTVNDGLPSNEVYEMMQDSKGFMWFATANGICRFNGYEFYEPVDTSGLAGSEAFLPIEDAEGRIWFNRLNQSLWFIEKDTVRAWKYNYIIDKYNEDFSVIDQLGIDKDGTVWLALVSLGFLQVKQDGSDSILMNPGNASLHFVQLNNNIEFAYQARRDAKAGEPITFDLVFWKTGVATILDHWKNVSPAARLGVWPLQNEMILAGFGDQYRLYDKLHALRQITISDILAEKVVQVNESQLLFASHAAGNPGLFHFQSLEHFIQGKYENLLPGSWVTDVTVDRLKGWWATTKNGGIYYCMDPSINVYHATSGSNEEEIISVTSDKRSKVFAGLRTGSILQLELPQNRISVIPAPSTFSEMIQVHYDILHHQLIFSNLLSRYRDRKWTSLQWVNQELQLNHPVPTKKVFVNEANTTLWVGSTHGFYAVDLATDSVSSFRENELEKNSLRTFAVGEDNAGNIWVATENGLRRWVNDHYELPFFHHSVLRSQARDMALLQDGSMAFCFAGNGILIYKDSVLTHLTMQHGLATNDISTLVADPDGKLYACTNQGLHIITNEGGWKIRSVKSDHGLPSNLVNDVTTLGDQLWVATDKGLVQLTSLPDLLPIPPPVLEHIKVQDSTIPYTANLRLSYDQDDITFRFFSLHYRSDGNILYRYKLHRSDSTYQYTRNREINFSKLSTGQFQFEVQAQNEDGTWSAPAKWPFEIRPPWWRTFWFIAFCVISIVASGWLYYSRRLKRIKNQAAQLAKIKDLELAALRAQMNPHFIFNCLNSIQQFISQHKPEEATRYLARFAKLVRLALHSSVDGKHSLADEIHMLDHYLALEQMRFKGSFEYTIDCDQSIDTEAIFIPPLLIQPFIENAVVHGMKSKAIDGRIAVYFHQQSGILEVTVTDNGPGFTSEVQELGGEHKSLGMKLTKNRLAMMDGIVDSHSYHNENETDDSGQVIGSKITVRLPFQ